MAKQVSTDEHEYTTYFMRCREIYDEVNGDRRTYFTRTANVGIKQEMASAYLQQFNRDKELKQHDALRELVDRFMHSGDSISEEEMNQLHGYFSNICNALKICPPEYRLVEISAHNQLRRVQQSLDAHAVSRRNR